MFILDFESKVTITDSNANTYNCDLKGFVVPDEPGHAGLGHSPTALASQSWKDLNLSSAVPLNFEEGIVVFPDNSNLFVLLSYLEMDQDKYLYKVMLLNEKPI